MKVKFILFYKLYPTEIKIIVIKNYLFFIYNYVIEVKINF